MNPARTEIEMALTQLGGVGNDGADAKCAPEKAVLPDVKRFVEPSVEQLLLKTVCTTLAA